MVMVETTMSTVPSVSDGIRAAEAMPRRSTFSGSPRTTRAISLAMSTSKPSILFVRGLRYPNSSTSCLTPARSTPRSWIALIKLPAGLAADAPVLAAGLAAGATGLEAGLAAGFAGSADLAAGAVGDGGAAGWHAAMMRLSAAVVERAATRWHTPAVHRFVV